MHTQTHTHSYTPVEIRNGTTSWENLYSDVCDQLRQTDLFSYRSSLQFWNFGYRNSRYYTVCTASNKDADQISRLLFVNIMDMFSHSIAQIMSHNMTKPTKWPVHTAKTLISLGIRPVWSMYSLSAWRNLGSLATHWIFSALRRLLWRRMARLIWIFVGHTGHFIGFLLV